jgi:hypothetical protein
LAGRVPGVGECVVAPFSRLPSGRRRAFGLDQSSSVFVGAGDLDGPAENRQRDVPRRFLYRRRGAHLSNREAVPVRMSLRSIAICCSDSAAATLRGMVGMLKSTVPANKVGRGLRGDGGVTDRLTSVLVGMVLSGLFGGLLVVACVHAQDHIERVKLAGGGAWILGGDGTATLVDGISGRSLARISVADSSDADGLRIAQTDDGAFVLNDVAGTVLRLDSSTLSTAGPAFAFGAPGSRLRVVRSGSDVFVASESSRSLTAVDPKTLGTMRRPLIFAGDLNSLVATPSGALWGIEPTGGVLVKLRDGSPPLVVVVGDTRNLRLVAPEGAPTLVDLVHGEAWSLNEKSGSRQRRTCVIVPASFNIDVAAADDRPLLAVLSSDSGSVTVADLRRPGCANPIPLDDLPVHDRYGPPVVLGGLVLLADLSTGEVVTVDASEISRPNVSRVNTGIGPDFGIQLFAHAGRVWFLDSSGTRFGNLTLAGEMVSFEIVRSSVTRPPDEATATSTMTAPTTSDPSSEAAATTFPAATTSSNRGSTSIGPSSVTTRPLSTTATSSSHATTTTATVIPTSSRTTTSTSVATTTTESAPKTSTTVATTTSSSSTTSVAKGCLMPNILGLRVSEMEAALNAAGCSSVRTQSDGIQCSNQYAAGQVMRQQPNEGEDPTALANGNFIGATFSDGPCRTSTTQQPTPTTAVGCGDGRPAPKPPGVCP